MKPLSDYFAKRSKRTGDCLIWTLRKDRDGYGRLHWKGRNGLRAHRVSYEQHVGPIPDGMTVDHMCFEPACINPGHLRLLTHVENSNNRRNVWVDECTKGHPLTEDNVYVAPRGRRGRRPERKCRECQAAHQRSHRARKAAA